MIPATLDRAGIWPTPLEGGDMDERMPQHGTQNEYSNHRCRCDACRSAHAEYNRAWAATHPVEIRNRSAAYRAGHANEIAAQRRDAYRANIDDRKRRRKERYSTTRDESKASVKEWQRANPDKVSANSRAWRAAHPEEAGAVSRRYAEAHPEVKRRIKANYRAKQKAAFIESVDPLVVFDRDGGNCQICLLPIGEAKWHIDHIIPIAHRGEHSYANTQLAHAVCNLKKNARLDYRHQP